MLRLEEVGLAEVDAAGSSRRSRGQTRRGEAMNGELGTGSDHGTI